MGFFLIISLIIVVAIVILKFLGDRGPKSSWARFAFVFSVLALFLYVSMPMHSYSYKVTIEAEIDGKKMSGSGVLKTTSQYMPAWTLSQKDWSTWSSGEVPVIDLGNGAALLATLGPSIPYNRCTPEPRGLVAAPAYALRETPPKHNRPAIYDIKKEQMFAALQAFQGRYALKSYEFPQFVLLTDRTNPATATIVCPNEAVESHGGTLHVRSVFVEMTSERPSGEIYQVLPWLGAMADDQRAANKFELRKHNLLGGWL